MRKFTPETRDILERGKKALKGHGYLIGHLTAGILSWEEYFEMSARYAPDIDAARREVERLVKADDDPFKCEPTI